MTLAERKSRALGLAVMDMWKPCRTATNAHAPQAAVLFDRFHIMRHLGEAFDKVRKGEYARLSGKDRRYIKGQRYTLLPKPLYALPEMHPSAAPSRSEPQRKRLRLRTVVLIPVK